MKKFWKTNRYKRYLKRKSRRRLKLRGGPRAFRRPLVSVRSRGYQRSRRPPNYEDIVAPTHLSLVRFPKAVSEFVDQLKRKLNRRRPVNVILKNVEDLDFDGITVLLSVMMQFKAHGIRFNGNYPTKFAAKTALVNSGFFTHLKMAEAPGKDAYVIRGSTLIGTHGKKIVDADLGASIIREASMTVWGEHRRCPGVQRTMLELMHNTNNHASLTVRGANHWWLSVKHHKESRSVSFAFVDYGVGVFESLHRKAPTSLWYRVLQNVFVLGVVNNAELLRLILTGQLRKTATGQPHRGKGLPGIFDALKSDKISNLVIVTNNVYFSSRDSHYEVMEFPFSGTFVYWELHPDNHSLKP